MLSKVEVKKHSHKTNGIKTNGKKEKSIQDIWDEELEDKNSPQFKTLLKLAERAKEQIRKDEVSDGGFGCEV
jgi:hypothetical protein